MVRSHLNMVQEEASTRSQLPNQYSPHLLSTPLQIYSWMQIGTQTECKARVTKHKKHNFKQQ